MFGRARDHPPKRPARVVLVCDDPDWAIGTMARCVQRFARSQSFDAPVISHRDFRAFGAASRELADADLIHWLSTSMWHQFGAAALADRSIVSIHHVDATEPWKCTLVEPRSYVTHSEGGVTQMQTTCMCTPDRVLPHGYDPAEFHEVLPHERSTARSKAHIDDDSLAIGVFGNASDRRKGVGLLIEALAVMAKQQRAIHLVLSGRGWDPHLAKLSSLVSGVTVLTSKSTAGLRERFALLDVYLCTSSLEGGPLPVLEALACGIPVVSTPVGHVPQLLRADGSNGRLVEADAAAIAFGVETLASLRDGSLTPQHIASSVHDWTWSAVGPEYVNCYSEMLAAQTGAEAGGLTRYVATDFAIARNWWRTTRGASKRFLYRTLVVRYRTVSNRKKSRGAGDSRSVTT